MTVTFDLPQELERDLRDRLGSVERAAKEAFLADLVRQHVISEIAFGEALGLHRMERDGVLKSHGVLHEYTLEDINREVESLMADLDR